MKPLDRQSEMVFRKLTEGLVTVGDCRKINGSIMAAFTEQTKLGPLVSITKFVDRPNGHLMRGTDVAFLISSIKAITGDLVQDADERIYPVSCRRSGLSQEALVIHNGRWNVRLELQTKICQFAERWILNISEQPNL
jgi:hypothetical protein